jgi:hypothetical protein
LQTPYNFDHPDFRTMAATYYPPQGASKLALIAECCRYIVSHHNVEQPCERERPLGFEEALINDHGLNTMQKPDVPALCVGAMPA